MAASSSQKRCLYEVLGLSKDCSPDEIRSAYKRLALQRHPDKLMKTGGLNEAEATAQFQELVHAYEVLSDSRERAWYDSHRSRILFSDRDSKSSGVSDLPNLFSFFSNSVYSGYSDTGKGFYEVYSDVFGKIYKNEVDFARTLGLRMDTVREAPVMGNLSSPYAQVTAFYSYWLGFSSVMDFCWVDQYDSALGMNRKSRRVMEEENKKLRRKARREYNETVRGLAEFVKKRDKRVIDMGLKKSAEMEKRKEEEREGRRRMEKERLEKARTYEEPEWAKVEEEEEEGMNGFEEKDSDKKEDDRNELYCVVCSKKFKSEKQWKNHEQSKKHKEKVAELKKSISDMEEEREENKEGEEEIDGYESVEESFKEGLKIEDEEDGDVGEEKNGEKVDQGSSEKDGFYDVEEDEDEAGGVEDEDDYMSMLKTMVSGHKNRRKNASSMDETEFLKMEARAEIESDEAEFPEYDKRKSKRNNRNGRREKGKMYGGKAITSDADETQNPDEVDKRNGNGHTEDSASESFVEHNSNNKADETEVLRTEIGFENVSDETGFMEYDNRKRTRKNRRGRKEKGKSSDGGPMANVDEIKNPYETVNWNYNRQMEESASEGFVGKESVDKANEPNEKASHPSLDTTTAKSKRSSKGKKAKGAAKNSGNMCDTCGEGFESRNKLHKHLGDTGHAKLKFR